MQRVKKLSIECVNKVKLEKVEEFQDSIFSDVYRNAQMQIERIMDMADAQGVDSEAEEFCIGNEISNVIAFVGERGMGKSSAMLSFAFFLKKYPENIQPGKSELFCLKKNGKIENRINFYTLSKIDVAILTNESLLDVVLAKMWTDFREKTEKLGENSFGLSHTKERFNSIKNVYTLYNRDEKQNKSLTSVRQLQELARSLALREEFARLVASFLECMVAEDNVAKKNRYLVIPIDDLDLASEKTIAILEQLRIFLSVPQVIILTTVDLEKLLMCGNKKFSDELLCQYNMDEDEKNLVRQYSDQYIAKALPRNSRISMPRYGGNAAVKYTLDYERYTSELMGEKGGALKRRGVDYFSFINIAIAKHLNLIIRHRDSLNVPGESLRNIVNKLNELWIICRCHPKQAENFVFEWLEKEIAISRKQFYGMESSSLMNELAVAPVDVYNEYIVGYFVAELRFSGELGYGQVLCAIQDTREDDYKERNLLRVLVLFYSLQLAKYVEERDWKTLQESLVRGDIFSSAISQKVRFKFEERRRIDRMLQLDLRYDEESEGIASIMRKNAQQIVDLFKVFLFCEVGNIVSSVELDIHRYSGGAKEIPELEGGAESGDTNQALTLEDVFEPYGDKLNEEINVKVQEDEAGRELPKENLMLEVRSKGVISWISLDVFFRNALEYERLFKKYVFWLCEQLNGFMLQNGQTKEEEQFEPLYEELLTASVNGVKEMRKWKKKYKIEGIYDIFPVQNAGVMLGVLDRMRRSGGRWTSIDQMMKGFSRAFVEEFRDAEDECLYEELGYHRYSEKLETLLELIDLDGVPQEIKNRLTVMGRSLEDTARIR